MTSAGMTKTELNQTLSSTVEFYRGNPPMDVLARELQVDENEARLLLKEYLAVNPYQAPAPVVKKPRRAAKRRSAKKTSPQTDAAPKKKPLKLHGIPVGALPWIAVIIGLIATGRSFFYVYDYFTRVDGVFAGILMGALFSGVSTMAPTIAIYAYTLRKWVIMGVAGLAFVIFGIFNVYVTTQELDYQKSVKETTLLSEQENIVRARDRIATLKEEVPKYQASIKSEESERDLTFTNIQNYKVGSVEFNRLTNRWSTLKDSIKANKAELEKKKAERTTLESIEGVYSTKVLTVQDMENKRAMDTVFGIGLEAVGPIFIAIAFFL